MAPATTVYYDGAQRKKKRYADLEEARREAELFAIKLANGENEVLRLTASDRSVYIQSLDHLRPLGMALNVAILEYVSAVKLLPEGTTLKEAVDFFRKRNPAILEKHTVREIVDEMIAAKRAAKLSKVHVKDLESRLGRFAADFQMDIGQVSRQMLQEWFDAMEALPRTKRNYLIQVAALFRFAVKRKYLAKDAIEEVESVQQEKEDTGEPEIFTPAEMLELLNVARPEMIPFLTIGGFAGLRSAELVRLDWSCVNLKERYIEIKAATAKTGALRLAPITDNLFAWLEPHARETGPVLGFGSWWNQIPKLVEAVNAHRRQQPEHAGNSSESVNTFQWKHNALRHSFCSYRLAATKNAAQVALEAGNSPKMIFAHYRQLVTETEAGKWFAVLPPREADNVIPLRQTAAA